MIEKEMPPFAKREESKYKNVTEAARRLVELSKRMRTTLKDFTSEQKGSIVQGTLRIKTDEPATALVLLLSMTPRAAKK